MAARKTSDKWLTSYSRRFDARLGGGRGRGGGATAAASTASKSTRDEAPTRYDEADDVSKNTLEGDSAWIKHCKIPSERGLKAKTDATDSSTKASRSMIGSEDNNVDEPNATGSSALINDKSLRASRNTTATVTCGDTQKQDSLADSTPPIPTRV